MITVNPMDRSVKVGSDFDPRPSQDHWQEDTAEDSILQKINIQREQLTYWEKEMFVLFKLTRWSRAQKNLSKDSKRQANLIIDLERLIQEFEEFENTLLMNPDGQTICIRDFRLLNENIQHFENRFKVEKMKMLDKLVEHFPVNFY